MKRIVTLTLILAEVFTFTGCSFNSKSNIKDGHITNTDNSPVATNSTERTKNPKNDNDITDIDNSSAVVSQEQNSNNTNNSTSSIEKQPVNTNEDHSTNNYDETITTTETPTQSIIDVQSNTSLNYYFSQKMFSQLPKEINIDIQEDCIYQSGIINNQDYSFKINLSAWEQYTTPNQIVELSRLFWQCYPAMYERFSDLSYPATNITLVIENNGYEVACTCGNSIHLHDKWLFESENDFDCITHELAHVIQNDWDGDYLESSEYIERFADCCRYEYAMDNGFYNDEVWDLQTVETEVNRFESVRFFVWLDYMYSDVDVDIMRNFMDVCRNKYYDADYWNLAWKDTFVDTEIADKTIDEVWEMYESSDFAYYSSYSQPSNLSDLLKTYPVRDKNFKLNP